MINADLQLDRRYADLSQSVFDTKRSELSAMRSWDALFDNFLLCHGHGVEQHSSSHTHGRACLVGNDLDDGYDDDHHEEREKHDGEEDHHHEDDDHDEEQDDHHHTDEDLDEHDDHDENDHPEHDGEDREANHDDKHEHKDEGDHQVDDEEQHAEHDQPASFILSPIFESSAEQDFVRGFVMLIFHWTTFVESLVTLGTNGMDLVISDSCGSVYTYRLHGDGFEFRGKGALQETTYNDMKRTVILDSEQDGEDDHQTHDICTYVLSMYPTRELHGQFTSHDPFLHALVVPAIFALTAVIFMFYDWTIKRRKERVVLTVQKTEAIVSSIFPKNVRGRLLDNVAMEDSRIKNQVNMTMGPSKTPTLYRIQPVSAQEKEEDEENLAGGSQIYKNASKPIADLFPDATVLFAEMDGFSAWNSLRQPSEVFEFLETMYRAFDQLARRHKVFKVETVGDCYVAVAGLPELRIDHALAMTQFAAACMVECGRICSILTRDFGPDTESMALRMGLHTDRKWNLWPRCVNHLIFNCTSQ